MINLLTFGSTFLRVRDNFISIISEGPARTLGLLVFRIIFSSIGNAFEINLILAMTTRTSNKSSAHFNDTKYLVARRMESAPFAFPFKGYSLRTLRPRPVTPYKGGLGVPLRSTSNRISLTGQRLGYGAQPLKLYL